MSIDIVVPADRPSPLVVGNKTFRSFFDIRVSEEDLERAKSELGETEELRDTSLRKLKEELKEDKTTHYRMDDDYLLRFLRYRKFDCEKTYKHIKNFYSFRRERPDVFTVPSNLESLMNQKLTKVIPYRDEEGSLIFWMDYRHLKDLHPLTACQLLTVVGDVLTMDPSCQINGVVGIWDMRGFSSFIRHGLNPWTILLLLRCIQTPRFSPISIFTHYRRKHGTSGIASAVEIGVKKICKEDGLGNLLLDCYPWRVKKLIAINANKIALAFYSTIRHVIKKKNRDKIVILGEDLTELKDHINPVLLPKEYGGTVEEEDCIYTKYIMDNLPYIKYERSFQ